MGKHHMYSSTYVSVFSWYNPITGESELPTTWRAFRFLIGLIYRQFHSHYREERSLSLVRTQRAQLLSLFFFKTTEWSIYKMKLLNTSGNNLT